MTPPRLTIACGLVLCLLAAPSLGQSADAVDETAARAARAQALAAKAASGAALTDAEIRELLEALPGERVDVPLVMLPVVVVDRRGRPIEDLRERDFTVLEDGRPVELTWFRRDASADLRLLLLIDASGSMRPPAAVERLRRALLPLMRRIHRKDRLRLVSFARHGDVRVHGPWTSRAMLTLRRVLEIPRGGRTAIADALVEAAGMLPRAPVDRQAIVLVSDGVDNASRESFAAVIDAARAVETPVYVIAVGGQGRRIAAERTPDGPLAALRAIARETGGRFFVASDPAAAAEAARRIEDDLRHQYWLAFRPSRPPDGRFRRLEVRLARPGLTARTRSGYR
ncbi:MAG: hypothetical protein Kow0062_16040 [Acidobacteriota bacterium]